MTDVASRAALLHEAVQDLHAGKVDAAKRLPAIAGKAADARLAALFRAEAARATAQAARLAAVAGDMAGPRNLWMAGMLDDAGRDGRSTQPGALLDVALIGAVRKAKAAEIVAAETAIALARATGEAAIGAACAADRGETIATDRALKALLIELAG